MLIYKCAGIECVVLIAYQKVCRGNYFVIDILYLDGDFYDSSMHLFLLGLISKLVGQLKYGVKFQCLFDARLNV